MAGVERSLVQAELSSLDWPDTDGLAAAHREVLELSVRHGLESSAVGLMRALQKLEHHHGDTAPADSVGSLLRSHPATPARLRSLFRPALLAGFA